MMGDDAYTAFEAQNRINVMWSDVMLASRRRTYWPGDESQEPKILTITHFSAQQYDDGWPDSGEMLAGDFMAWLQARLDEIPSEHRRSATIEIGSASGYEDSHYAEITIRYRRPETPEEVAERVAGYAAQCARQEEKARAEFEALKQRFEPR